MNRNQANRAVKALLGNSYSVRAGKAKTGNVVGHSHQWHQVCNCWYVERYGVEVAHGDGWISAIMGAVFVVTGERILTTDVKEAAKDSPKKKVAV